MNIYEHQKHGTPKQTQASQPGVESEMNPRPIQFVVEGIENITSEQWDKTFKTNIYLCFLYDQIRGTTP